jgi:hypothetical protein
MSADKTAEDDFRVAIAAERWTPPFARRVVRVASIELDADFDRDLSTTYIEMIAVIVGKYGLRDAITFTADGRLVAGARWLAAVRKLGWEFVEVTVVEDAT